MCSEIDLANMDRFNLGFREMFEPTQNIKGSTFHGAIFSSMNYTSVLHFAKNAALPTTLSELMQKTQHIARTCGAITIFKARLGGGGEVTGEVEFEATWGGKDGSKFSASAKGSFRDDKGNTAEVKFKQDSDGKGTVNAAIKRTKNSDKK